MIYVALGLLVLLGIGWLVSTISKEFRDGIAQAKLKSIERRRRRASEWCEFYIPSDLDDIARQIAHAANAVPSIETRRPPPFRYQFPSYPHYVKLVPTIREFCSTSISVNDLKAIRSLTEPSPAGTIANAAARHCSFLHAAPKRPELPVWRKDLNRLQINLPQVKFQIKPTFKKKEKEIREVFEDTISKAAKAGVQLADLRAQLDDVNDSINKANAAYQEARDAIERDAEAAYTQAVRNFRLAASSYLSECRRETEEFRRVMSGYSNEGSREFIEYFAVGLALIQLPHWLSNAFKLGWDIDSRALIVELQLPNLPDVTFDKPRMAKRERKRLLEEVHPACLLRVACEVARLDTDKRVSLVAVNGLVNYRSRTTGKPLSAYVASLIGDARDLAEVALADTDAVACFKHFRGQSAFVVDDVVPTRPTLVLDRNDPRFIAGREVMESLDGQANLATMEWQDFEHLIRELFEQLFKGDGVEVKVTQASRDRGVDAVVLDPNPIRGGKTVIQAKRYINTVELSAVRDLFGTVHNEGASRGILVTTSNFGPDAYQFAEGKPLTLINGSQLLGYLKDAGKQVRIDLEEARRLVRASMI